MDIMLLSIIAGISLPCIIVVLVLFSRKNKSRENAAFKRIEREEARALKKRMKGIKKDNK